MWWKKHLKIGELNLEVGINQNDHSLVPPLAERSADQLNDPVAQWLELTAFNPPQHMVDSQWPSVTQVPPFA